MKGLIVMCYLLSGIVSLEGISWCSCKAVEKSKIISAANAALDTHATCYEDDIRDGAVTTRQLFLIEW